jgi:antitoxin component YwqK of YwqJK toxin-antitoxin module
MRNFLILFILFTADFQYVTSQRIDTIYYDKKWNSTTKKAFKYYRITRQDSNKVAIFDYYKSGRIQMSGGYKSFDFKEETGPFNYYKKNRIYHIQLYEPSKYPSFLLKFKGVLENVPQQPDSLYLSIYFNRNNTVNSIGYVSECCYYFGPWFYFSKKGDLIYMSTYFNDKLNGPHFVYINDKIWYSGTYKNGKRDGEWKFYFFDGVLKKTVYYDSGKVIKKIR